MEREAAAALTLAPYREHPREVLTPSEVLDRFFEALEAPFDTRAGDPELEDFRRVMGLT